MAKFIELIDADDRKWRVNTEHIVSFYESRSADFPTTVRLVDGYQFHVKHSLHEVLAKVDEKL